VNLHIKFYREVSVQIFNRSQLNHNIYSDIYVLAHAFDSRMIEVVLMTRPEAGMCVESSVSRSVFLLVKSQVPFADVVRTVAKLSQIFRQDLLVQWQSSGFGTFENLNYS